MPAWTQDDIDALRAAIAKGAVLQSMTFADQTYTFRSLKDMLSLLSIMESQANTGRRYRLAATSKGA